MLVFCISIWIVPSVYGKTYKYCSRIFYCDCTEFIDCCEWNWHNNIEFCESINNTFLYLRLHPFLSYALLFLVYRLCMSLVTFMSGYFILNANTNIFNLNFWLLIANIYRNTIDFWGNLLNSFFRFSNFFYRFHRIFYTKDYQDCDKR